VFYKILNFVLFLLLKDAKIPAIGFLTRKLNHSPTLSNRLKVEKFHYLCRQGVLGC